MYGDDVLVSPMSGGEESKGGGDEEEMTYLIKRGALDLDMDAMRQGEETNIASLGENLDNRGSESTGADNNGGCGGSDNKGKGENMAKDGGGPDNEGSEGAGADKAGGKGEDLAKDGGGPLNEGGKGTGADSQGCKESNPDNEGGKGDALDNTGMRKAPDSEDTLSVLTQFSPTPEPIPKRQVVHLSPPKTRLRTRTT